MPAYSVSQPFKPRKYELINKYSKSIAFKGYSERQALELIKAFPHLAMRPQKAA